MAIVWADNFQMYGPVTTTSIAATSTLRMLNGSYAEMTGAGSNSPIILERDPDPTGTGRPVLAFWMHFSIARCRKVLPSAQFTVGQACRIWFETLPGPASTGPNIAAFRDVAGTLLVSVFVDPSGRIRVFRGNFDSGTLLGQTTGPVIVANAWQHVETKVVFHNVAGSVEVRVEGVPVLNITGVNTSANNLPCQQTGFATTNDNVISQLFFKDYVIWDTTGAFNTDFLGSVSVFSLHTNSDEALNWTPSTGTTGWNILDNFPPADTTEFLSAGLPLPSPYVGTLTNLPPDVTSVRAIQTTVRARKTDGGDGNIQVSMLSGAAAALGANRPITAAYTYWSDVFEQDPTTSLAWTPVSVNAARIRLNRTV